MKDYAQQSQELWLKYLSTAPNALQEEKFWKKYGKLKGEVQGLRKKYLSDPSTQITHSNNFITNVFQSDKKLKHKFRQKLLKAKLKSMAIIYAALGVFTYTSLFIFSLTPVIGHFFFGFCIMLFSTTLVINYIVERPLANTCIELQPYALLRKGKGLRTVSIRYDEIADLEEDELGLYIKKRATSRGSHYQYEEHETLTIPSIISNYEQFKQLLVSKWKKQ